ncbi:metal ABC transporter ATP-binding protein [Ammoniphilus sp. YIM 78166]|uniref:metal ABC transporter ATP-binding protein n=1 Tax=Ammoniphilus sp. YIM 78166 TaxID=1644106 RepID=UPI00106F195B|nr:metal ABC transporter ATP-binding protein [Ammoniphilus sp. YIM 78166]
MSEVAKVEVKDLSVSYYGNRVLENITFSISAGQLMGVIGPNGAGKSTLMKAVLGLLPVDHGSIQVFGQPVPQVRKRMAYVPQRNQVDLDFPVLVEDVVVMGRFPHLKWWSRPGKKDREVAAQCLEQVGMMDFSKRQIGELSGGQQQRVFLARALAQEADLIILDEPFVGIDVTSEQIIIDILRRLRNGGSTLFVVHHDLSKAESYFDSILLLNRRLVASGPAACVFNIENLQEAYQGKAAIFSREEGMVMVGT